MWRQASERNMIIGIDLGSARTAMVAARSSAPLHIAAATVIEVNPTGADTETLDVEPAVDEIVACIQDASAEIVVIEYQPWFPMAGKDAAAQMAMNRALAVCRDQKNELLRRLAEQGYKLVAIDAWARRPPGRVVTVVPRSTWAHRVVPHHKGGISDDAAWEGLRPHIAEGVELLDTDGKRDQDKRDAAGVLMAVLFPAPRRPRSRSSGAPSKSELTAEEKEARAEARRAYKTAWQAHARGKLSAEERRAAGCSCKTKHRANCQLYRDIIDPLDVLLGLA